MTQSGDRGRRWWGKKRREGCPNSRSREMKTVNYHGGLLCSKWTSISTVSLDFARLNLRPYKIYIQYLSASTILRLCRLPACTS